MSPGSDYEAAYKHAKAYISELNIVIKMQRERTRSLMQIISVLVIALVLSVLIHLFV